MVCIVWRCGLGSPRQASFGRFGVILWAPAVAVDPPGAMPAPAAGLPPDRRAAAAGSQSLSLSPAPLSPFAFLLCGACSIVRRTPPGKLSPRLVPPDVSGDHSPAAALPSTREETARERRLVGHLATVEDALVALFRCCRQAVGSGQALLCPRGLLSPFGYHPILPNMW